MNFVLLTPRAIMLIVLGAIPAALAWRGGYALAGLLYNVLVLGLALADFLAAAGSRDLGISREAEKTLSVGEARTVRVNVRNLLPRRAKLVLKDDVPAALGAKARLATAVIPSGGRHQWAYSVIPNERGDHAFGAVHIRSTGPLGLAVRQFAVPLAQEVKVFPSLREIRRHQILARGGKLLEAGQKRVRVPGMGTEFESTRDYVTDDEYRAINWTATARRGKLVTNVYETERSQNVILVIDAGRLMVGLAGRMSKLDHALDAALMLAYVSVTRGDRVGFLVFSDRVKVYLPPGKGREHLYRVMNAVYNLRPDLVEADYAGVVQFLRLKTKKRSLICFFTDLIDPEASGDLLAHLSSLKPEHLPVCLTLRDPEILALAGQDAGDSPAFYEKAMAEHVLAERGRALAALRSRGALSLDVAPEELTAAAINQYLEIKARGRL